MSKKIARLLGLALLLGALIAVWHFTPATLPTRYSQSGFTIIKRQAVQRLAIAYLLAGMGAGFGLALLVYSVLPPEKPVSPPGTQPKTP